MRDVGADKVVVARVNYDDDGMMGGTAWARAGVAATSLLGWHICRLHMW